jgi:hypothetical protein
MVHSMPRDAVSEQEQTAIAPPKVIILKRVDRVVTNPLWRSHGGLNQISLHLRQTCDAQSTRARFYTEVFLS